MNIDVEILQPDTWEELKHAFPEHAAAADQYSIMLAVVEDEKIVAVLGLQSLACVSPSWVEKQQAQPGSERLPCMVAELLSRRGTDQIVVTTNPFVEKLLFAMGLAPLRGAAWASRSSDY